MADMTVRTGCAPSDCGQCGGKAETVCIFPKFSHVDYGHFACKACGISFDSNVNDTLNLRLDPAAIRDIGDEGEYRRLFVETSHIATDDGTVYADFDWTDNAAVKHGVAKHVVEVVKRHAASHAITDILDLGCGNGFTAIELSRQFPASRVLAIDPSPDVLKVNGQEGVRALQGTLDSLHLPDASFDAVAIIGNLMLHINPRTTLSEARRVLRPGGLLVIDFKNVDASARRLAKLMARLGLSRIMPRGILERLFVNMRWGFNRSYMERLCAGLDLTLVETYSKPPRLLEFANASAHQRGLRGVIWRMSDRWDAWTDQRAWVHMCFRK